MLDNLAGGTGGEKGKAGVNGMLGLSFLSKFKEQLPTFGAMDDEITFSSTKNADLTEA